MPKSARLDLRVDPDLKARVEALAAERGQTLTVFVERALLAALDTNIIGPCEVCGHGSIWRATDGRVLHPGCATDTPATQASVNQARTVRTAPSFNRVRTLKR